MDETIQALVGMAEYEGTLQAFKHESAAQVRGILHCSEQEADIMLADLQEKGRIAIRLTQGGELPENDSFQFGRWYWEVPEEVA